MLLGNALWSKRLDFSTLLVTCLLAALVCSLIILDGPTSDSSSSHTKPNASARNLFAFDQLIAQQPLDSVHLEDRHSKLVRSPKKGRLHDSRLGVERHSREAKMQGKSNRVAVLVAGSFHRYFLQSSAEKLVAPLRRQGYSVDYFMSLTTEVAKPYRAELGYTQHASWDPVFSNGTSTDIPNDTRITATVHDVLVKGAGANLRYFSLSKQIDVEEDPRIRKLHHRASKQHPKEDVDLRFPTLDMSSGARHAANAVANKNIIRLFMSMERLWGSLLDAERADGEPFDFVLFLRDDTKWLADFDMNRLRAQGTADVYLLSCDARVPTLSPDEINDHGLVVHRKVAETFGLYLTRLLESDIEACKNRMHKPSWEKVLPKFARDAVGERGCNSEMLLKWQIDLAKLQVLKVGQRLIPFQRSMHLNLNGKVVDCFHKYCKSFQDDLGDSGFQRCSAIKI